MSALLERLTRGPLLWLDDWQYSARLLAADGVPWFDVTQLVAWRSKAQGLLKSDVISLQLGALVSAWTAERPAGQNSATKSKRIAAPLRQALGDAKLREHIGAVASALASTNPQQVLALELPSPRHWLASVCDASIVIGADEVDEAAAYVAEFLRSFGDRGVQAVMLREKAGNEPASDEELSWYEAVINVSRHFRWDIGIHLPRAAAQVDETVFACLDFVIAPHQIGTTGGVILPDEFWSGAGRADASFVYATVPPELKPEQVLLRLTALRD